MIPTATKRFILSDGDTLYMVVGDKALKMNNVEFDSFRWTQKSYEMANFRADDFGYQRQMHQLPNIEGEIKFSSREAEEIDDIPEMVDLSDIDIHSLLEEVRNKFSEE